MQILNLIKEFEMHKMKEKKKTIKAYFDKFLSIVNKVRLLVRDFFDDRIVQINLVSVPKKYESKFFSLEESKNLSKHILVRIGECTISTRIKENDEIRRINGRCSSSKDRNLKRM